MAGVGRNERASVTPENRGMTPHHHPSAFSELLTLPVEERCIRVRYAQTDCIEAAIKSIRVWVDDFFRLLTQNRIVQRAWEKAMQKNSVEILQRRKVANGLDSARF